MRLLDDDIAPGRGDHPLMDDALQTWALSDCGPIAAEPSGMDDFSDIVVSQQLGQESLRRSSVPMLLEENVEHETVLVHGPPKPMSDLINARTHLVDRPPGTPVGVPGGVGLQRRGAELDAPLAEGLVADFHAALVEPFLHVSAPQRKAVVQPGRRAG